MNSEVAAADGTTCPACHSGRISRSFSAEERLFRTGETFEYRECESCGTVRLAEFEEAQVEYPAHYYAYRSDRLPDAARAELLQRRIRLEIVTRLPRPIHRQISRDRPWLRWLENARPSSRVLDFGCGSGELLSSLWLRGYRRLEGFEPNLPPDTSTPARIRIHTQRSEVVGTFDVVMAHHAFEHVPSPGEVFQWLAGLAGDGTILMRIPVASSAAWREYGPDWVQLDPPRHRTLFTSEGLRQFAERHGCEVFRMEHDSTAFQFWGSELTRRRVPVAGHDFETTFGRNQLDAWDDCARRRNTVASGDQAAFWIRKKRSSD